MSASYLLKRLAYLLVTLLLVSVVVFGITQILPANAAQMLLGEYATPEALAAIEAKLGLNDPAYVQYLRWLGSFVQGDLGTSIRTGQPVGETILLALSRSMLLATFALVFVIIVAIPLGIIAATRRGKATDLGVSLISYIGISLPEFVTATMLVVFLARPELGWFPVSGYVSFLESPLTSLWHMTLPILALVIVLTAHVVRMVRSEMVDVLQSDYVRAARLKGLDRRTVLFKHALRNAMLPTITILALDVGYLIGGIIVVEEIFAFPGVGRQLILAIQQRDLPMIQAGAMVMAVTYALANLGADLAYAALDKRIQFD
jgi:peptide/nickel transport system permease protein